MFKTGNNLFWKTLAAFMLFACILSSFFGYFIFLAIERFGLFLVQEQAAPVMAALIESEKQHRLWNDNFHTTKIAHSINGEFYVGKRVPDGIRELGYGLHIEGSNFFYVVNEGGIMYALTGSSKAFQLFLADISGTMLYGCCLGFTLAAVIALFLSRRLSFPLINLAKSIQDCTSPTDFIPVNLAARKDEIGLVAAAMLDFQKEAKKNYEREANFAGDISHELRTPLAALLGSIELLRVRLMNGSSQEKEHLARMERSVRQMASSVRSVLALARKNKPVAEYIDINEILNTEIARLRSDEIYKKNEITIHKRGCPAALGHSDMASTVLGNILVNACQHSADSNVAVRTGSQYVSIANGIKNGAAASAGYGLGLSIARRCCEKMGWKLRIKTKDDRIVILVTFGQPGHLHIENSQIM